MKKILAIIAILMATVSFAKAQNYEGTYTGTLDEITMNDSTYQSRSGISFEVESTNLYGTVGQVGSMPGTIVIDLPISVTSGTITATPGDACGQLKVFGVIPFTLYLTSLYDATTDGTTLEFTLECTGTYFGKTYNAHVHFVGTK